MGRGLGDTKVSSEVKVFKDTNGKYNIKLEPEAALILFNYLSLNLSLQPKDEIFNIPVRVMNGLHDCSNSLDDFDSEQDKGK